MFGTGWSFASHDAHLTVSEFLENILSLVRRLKIVEQEKKKMGKKILTESIECRLLPVHSHRSSFLYESVLGSIRRMTTFP